MSFESDNKAKMGKNSRIAREAVSMAREPPPGCSAGPIDSERIDRWHATIAGPPETVYEGGIFEMEITFPPQYPFKPPKIKFLTKIFHCNIYEKNVCLDTLKSGWTPALTIDKVLLSIGTLLQDPNPKDPLNREAAELYINNREEYDQKARDWVKMYASGESSNDGL